MKIYGNVRRIYGAAGRKSKKCVFFSLCVILLFLLMVKQCKYFTRKHFKKMTQTNNLTGCRNLHKSMQVTTNKNIVFNSRIKITPYIIFLTKKFLIMKWQVTIKFDMAESG